MVLHRPFDPARLIRHVEHLMAIATSSRAIWRDPIFILRVILIVMTHIKIFSKVLSALLLIITFSSSLFAQKSPSYSGDWALRLGDQVFIVVSLETIPNGTGNYSGFLTRPQHFSTAGGASFSGISGPVIRFRIV